VSSLRARLILLFLSATLAPLAATWWLATSLFDRSLEYASTDQLDRVSRALEVAGREFYQQAREALKHDAESQRQQPRVWASPNEAKWPEQVRAFRQSGDGERFELSRDGQNVLLYFVRRPEGVWSYSRPLGVDMGRVGDEYRRAREAVERARSLDLRRGFNSTFVLVAAAVWGFSLALLVLMAYRMTRPIRQLTAGLNRLASGDESVRLKLAGGDEVGRAIRAFNGMAAQLAENRERLVYLTQMASWQLLARKMAHELKNSLTPIRLTMEEIIARNEGTGDPLIEQAARIVVDEAESLERRIRAFSEFAAEPPVNPRAVAVNAAVEERIAFLRPGHPEVRYSTLLLTELPEVQADPDLLNGILTNLLENAAEAAGPGGEVLATTAMRESGVAIEIQDSGPGLSPEARRSLFEPTISFKRRGMGLGLSIARKNALLMGGDITLVEGTLGGAAFRVSLAAARAPESSVISFSERAAVSPRATRHAVP